MLKDDSSTRLREATAAAMRDSILASWRTSARVTAFLIEGLPAELWDEKVPGVPRKTVRMLCAHLHNARCGWIRTLGREFGIEVPAHVDRFKLTAEGLVVALAGSEAGIRSLLKLGWEQGGTIPAAKTYVWRNLPLDVGHVLSYFVAHEGHHRGQVVMLARQLGYRLPAAVTNGLWDWTRWVREGRRG